jgi:ABC-type transport system substrate-binding protein
VHATPTGPRRWTLRLLADTLAELRYIDGVPYETDPQQRHETYKRCQAIQHDTAWWGFIWLQPWNWVYNKRVKNVPPMYSSFWREEQMWLE